MNLWIRSMNFVSLCLIFFTLATFTLSEGKRVKRIVGGTQAKAPPPDDPVVFTRAFKRDARVEGFRNSRTGIYTFLGMYYAEAPIGEHRYTRPIYKRLMGDINATRHGPPCLQPNPTNPSLIIGSEDCLLLNVYTPQMPDESTGLPVYVWLHPGGFRYGSAAQYDATPMAQSGLIVVVPQYRLGSLGIIGDGTKDFDGNLAIFDMATALRWVADYIKYFGGDPNQIKVIGHGSGAASAMFLSMAKATRSASSLNGVVAMSGTALSQYSLDKEPVNSLDEIARKNGCEPVNKTAIVNCMRQMSGADIIRNDNDLQTERLAGRNMVKSLGGSAGFQPHAEQKDDHRGLPGMIIDPPDKQLKEHNFLPIPLLTGVAVHETANGLSLNAIEEVFGSADQFVNNLKSSLLELGSLLRVDNLTGTVLKPELPGLLRSVTPTLDDILKIPSSLGIPQVINKLQESTTDIFFNLPMALTSQLWASFSSSLMYSFEYKGNRSRGINFLQGLPLVRGSDPEKVGHGDEIGYLFDANDIFGNPLPDTRLESGTDLTVRKNMINLLKKFANPEKSVGSFLDGLTKTLLGDISGTKNPYVKINTTLELGSDFRFCELSVLGAALKPLAATTCQHLTGLLGQVSAPIDSITNTLSGVGGNVGNILGGSSLTNGNSGSTPKNLFGGGSFLGLG